MNSVKWLERIYPDSFKEIMGYFSSRELINFKKSNFLLGRLTVDVKRGHLYEKGTLIQFQKRDGRLISDGPPDYECIVKHKEEYHFFTVNETKFNHVT